MDGSADNRAGGKQVMKSAINDSPYAYDLGGDSCSILAERTRADKENGICAPVAENEQSSSLRYFSVEKTRAGMAVAMLNHMASTKILPKVQLSYVQLAFFSLYSGQIDIEWEGGKGCGHASFTPGNYALSCSAGNYAISVKTELPCKLIGITLTPETLQAIVGPDDIHSIALSRTYPDADDVRICWQDSMPSTQASLAGSQLLGCAMTGKSRQLYLESKSTELLSVYLDMLQGQNLRFDDFSRDDIQKLYNARNILMERMAAPPGISELSRLCCINEFKLKKGFKKIFRQTVFGFLRKERMAQAKRLMEERGYSVSNAAYEVGYSSISRFIAAFKGEYGATPGTLSLKKK
jgi:AraC-like DNA-binding protein